MKAKKGDIIRYSDKIPLCRVERVMGKGNKKTVVLQEMDRDRLGRLRSIGEEGRFSSTEWALSRPIYKRK